MLVDNLLGLFILNTYFGIHGIQYTVVLKAYVIRKTPISYKYKNTYYIIQYYTILTTTILIQKVWEMVCVCVAVDVNIKILKSNNHYRSKNDSILYTNLYR
jgi:hypothetical protein